jgi:hypothetical protein
MAGVVDIIFGKLDSAWSGCPQCGAGALQLDGLVAKYPALKVHLENVFQTRAVTPVKGNSAHYAAETNTMTLPHTGEATGADNIVDGIIFESYNAIRQDQFTNCGRLLKDDHQPVASGTQTALTEGETLSDYFDLAKGMDPADRTANMTRCFTKYQASASVINACLASPHEEDAVKRAALPSYDERRLPTGVMYIYLNIVNSTTIQIRCAFLKMCQVNFTLIQPTGKTTPARAVVNGSGSPVDTAAAALDAYVAANWPGAAGEAGKYRRPGALMLILDKVQNDAQYTALRGLLTFAAFGFTAEMQLMGRQNLQGFALK